MKKLLAITFLPVMAFATEQNNLDTNTQSNQSSTSSHGTQANYQINNSNDMFHRIGDTACAAPVVDIGITDRESGDSAMFYTSVSIPLMGGTCRKAQKTKLRRMRLDYDIAREEQEKRNIIFKEKLAQICTAHPTIEECYNEQP